VLGEQIVKVSFVAAGVLWALAGLLVALIAVVFIPLAQALPFFAVAASMLGLAGSSFDRAVSRPLRR
jgi:hypothetical protein